MVPTTLIVLILLVIEPVLALMLAVVLGSVYIVIYLVTLVLAVVDVRIVWLSWVLLAIAILSLVGSIPLWQRAAAAKRARERRIAEHRARGH